VTDTVANALATPDHEQPYAALGLKPDEYARIRELIGRTPSFTELAVFSVMWSEHCSYKSSRVHLRRLHTEGPRVVQGPGENAGIVDIGDGFGAVFKMESHNHPSFLDAYNGAATGIGGILRDVFTMGARPVAALNSLRFGRPDHPKTPELLRGVVRGMADYGNTVGVPCVGGELQFDPSYDGNILVNAFVCGIVAQDRIFYGRASGIGNPVIYVGAKTGREGVHGATMASDEFTQSEDGTPQVKTQVAVGNPELEKRLMEACLEIFSQDILEGVQDMGAAGLTSSSVEMASRSGTGLELDLDLVPRAEKGLLPFEMLLSETQERMLLVAKKGCEQQVFDICKKWNVEAVVIGRVTDSGRWVVKATPGYDPLEGGALPGEDAKKVVCDLPVSPLTDGAPKYDRPRAIDTKLDAVRAFDPATIPAPTSFSEELVRMMGSPNVGSRGWIAKQFDGSDDVLVGAGSDAAVVRVGCKRGDETVEKVLAFKTDCNGRFVYLDPYWGAAMAVAEVCRNLAVTGAEPLGLTDGLNFGSPERPEIMEQFARAIDGIADACKALGVPVVSGNVSLYNETDGQAILPTPGIAGVGLVESRDQVVTLSFKKEGESIVLLGSQENLRLGGSEYVVAKTGRVQGPLPALDLEAEKRLQALVLRLAREKLVSSMHDVADGGLAIALAEACVATATEGEMVGADVTLSASDDVPALLFAENPSRVVASLPTSHLERVEKLAAEAGIPLVKLGTTTKGNLTIRVGEQAVVDLPLAQLREARERCLEGIVGKG